MTDIYGYATAAPLYRAAGWMQVIPLPEGARPRRPAGSRDAAANPSPTSRYGSGRRRPRTRTRESSSPRRIGVGHRRRTRPSGQGGRGERHQRTLSGTGHASGHVEQHGARHRQPGTPPVLQGARSSPGRAEPSRGSTSCSPATGIPWSGRRSTRAAKCTAGTRQAAHSPAHSPTSRIWRHCHGSGWTICASPTICRTRRN